MIERNLEFSIFSGIIDMLISYTYGGSEYSSPGAGTGGSGGYYNHQAMTNYELSADYVDSTTAYDPRPNQTQVDAVAPDTPTVTPTAGVLPSVVTTGNYYFSLFPRSLHIFTTNISSLYARPIRLSAFSAAARKNHSRTRSIRKKTLDSVSRATLPLFR